MLARVTVAALLSSFATPAKSLKKTRRRKLNSTKIKMKSRERREGLFLRTPIKFR